MISGYGFCDNMTISYAWLCYFLLANDSDEADSSANLPAVSAVPAASGYNAAAAGPSRPWYSATSLASSDLTSPTLRLPGKFNTKVNPLNTPGHTLITDYLKFLLVEKQ